MEPFLMGLESVFAKAFGIKILNSTPYYAQANGQVEAIDKIIKNNLRKVIDYNILH